MRREAPIQEWGMGDRIMDYVRIISEAKERLAVLNEERESLEALVSHAERLARLIPSAGRPQPSAEAPAKKSGALRPSSLVRPTRDAVRQILEEAGKPMSTRDLVPEVLRRGIVIGGKDEIATLSARLSSGEEFKTHRNIGWWFAGRALPMEQHSFDEAEGQGLDIEPSASNQNKEGGDYHAPALT